MIRVHVRDDPQPSPEAEGPRPVSPFEFHLLRILRFLIGQFPADQGLQLVRQSLSRPRCLQRAAVELVKDTLSKGTVLFLVRQGGWRNERFLRGGRPTPGRVWQRGPLEELSLSFSAAVLEFLIWITAEKPHSSLVTWDADPNALTPADELFFCMAFDAVRTDPELKSALLRMEVFRSNRLCWLSFPGEMVLAGQPAHAPPVIPDFRPLFEGQRAIILECLQEHLKQRWLRSERTKAQIKDWERMRQQGRAESAALEAFLAAAGAAGRTDLARFLLRVNAVLFRTERTPAFWTEGLAGSGQGRLAERLDTQRVALAVPRQMAVFERWNAHARTVGYFDDEYEASQMWKSEWETLDGDRVAARARSTLQMLEPLQGVSPPNRPHADTDPPTAEAREDDPN